MSKNNDNWKIYLATSGVLTLAAIFNPHAEPVTALPDFTQTAKRVGLSPEEAVRRFDGLCVGGASKHDDNDTDVFARFLPNKYDYYTKRSLNSPITRGEHMRPQLIQDEARVNMFIESVSRNDESRLGDHMRLQLKEFMAASQSFREFDSVTQHKLQSCDRPFPAPKPVK